ncbi:MAG: hypothetical protein IE922_00465, partial [Sphingomonadales bacterium]|nr:hypothetical protein [Sphingomonadales bacterium]
INDIGAPFIVTTGRRLRDEGWPAGVDTIAVMLDGECSFRSIDAKGVTIWWGAYVGMADAITVSGPLAEMAPRIVAAAVDDACPAPVIYTLGYGEPSLIFLSPGPVRDTTPEAAQAHLAEPCARVLLPADLTLNGRVRARIEGLNLGNGQALDLQLWSAD